MWTGSCFHRDGGKCSHSKIHMKPCEKPPSYSWRALGTLFISANGKHWRWVYRRLVFWSISHRPNTMQQMATLRICSVIQYSCSTKHIVDDSLPYEQVTSDMSQITRWHRTCVKLQWWWCARAQDTHLGCHTASTEWKSLRLTRVKYGRGDERLLQTWTEKCGLLQPSMYASTRWTGQTTLGPSTKEPE